MHKAIRIGDSIFKTLLVLSVLIGIAFFFNKSFAQGISGGVGSDAGDADTLIRKETEPRDPNACLTCSMVIVYANLSNEYVRKLSDAILPGMQLMFGSLVGLWVVLNGYKLLAGILQPQQLYVEFIYVAVGFILLNHVGADFINDVYHASLSVMSGASSIAFAPAGTPSINPTGLGASIDVAQYKNLVNLIFTTEKSILKVIDLASSLISKGKWFDGSLFISIFYAIILALPYFLVMVVFFAQVTIAIFRLMMLAAFSPFLMMAYAFGWGRGMGQAAIRTLISSIAVMFAVTAAIAMVVYAVSNTDINGLGTELSFTNTRLLVLIILGWLSTAFMTEATAIANSITGSALSNTGVGTITAGALATGAGVLSQRHKINPLAWGRGYANMGASVGQGIGGLSSLKGDISRPANLYDKFKSVSRGGSS